MEFEKRKRDSQEEPPGEKRGKAEDSDGAGVKAELPPPPDEEVDEFFAILKRIHVAIKYFENKNAHPQLTPALEESYKLQWRPLFQPEDFHGVDKGTDRTRYPDLDLNSDPASDASDSV